MEHRKWPQEPAHKTAVLEGYASVRPVPNYREVMPLLRLGRALAVIGFSVRSDTWRDKNRAIYQYNRDYLDRFAFAA